MGTRQIAKGKKMASFFDDEAEVGTTDDEDEMETEGTLKKKKQKTNMISSDEDDESDDEEKAREEMQGFIADDADDLDEPVRQKKRKKDGKNDLVQDLARQRKKISTTMTENFSKKIWESTLSRNAKGFEWNPDLRIPLLKVKVPGMKYRI